MKRINVTQEHINNGEKFDCNKCPIALATKGTIFFLSIIIRQKKYNDPAYTFSEYDLPEKALDFISDFDYDKKVKPFSFNLKV